MKWKTVNTGYYADPQLYKSYNGAAVGATLGYLGKFFEGMASGNLAGAVFNTVGDVLSSKKDMTQLIKRNKCSNKGLERFGYNLARYVSGQGALRLPTRELLSDMTMNSN